MKHETIGLLVCLLWALLISVRYLLLRRAKRCREMREAAKVDRRTRSRSEQLLALQANGRDE